MRLPDPYRWLEWPLQAWCDWSCDDRIGIGYATLAADRMPVSRARPQISIPDTVLNVERVICALPAKWREVVRAEWIFRWPHKLTAKRMHISRPTHLALRKHAYGAMAERLAHLDRFTSEADSGIGNATVDLTTVFPDHAQTP